MNEYDECIEYLELYYKQCSQNNYSAAHNTNKNTLIVLKLLRNTFTTTTQCYLKAYKMSVKS